MSRFKFVMMLVSTDTVTFTSSLIFSFPCQTNPNETFYKHISIKPTTCVYKDMMKLIHNR